MRKPGCELAGNRNSDAGKVSNQIVRNSTGGELCAATGAIGLLHVPPLLTSWHPRPLVSFYVCFCVVSTGPVVVRLAGMANERERERAATRQVCRLFTASSLKRRGRRLSPR